MKKLFALLIISAVLVSAAACKNSAPVETTAARTETTETASKNTAAPSTAKPTETAAKDKEKKKSPTEKKEKVKKTKPTTMPPTQGKTKPNTRVAVIRPSKGSFSASDLVFKHKGKSINLGDDIETVFKKFGEDYALGEVSDTEFEYEYDGFTVGTFTKNKKEKVGYITISEENVSTPKGVKIGSYASRLKRYYGDAKKVTETEYIYGSGSKTLSFSYEDNIVTEINYIYNH